MKKSIFKILILVSVVYAVIMMIHWPIGFTFFTQLSNLFSAAAVSLQLAYTAFPGKKRDSAGSQPGHDSGETEYPRWLYILKYMAVVSIIITFLVYLCILAPLTPGGFISAYLEDHCASLCMHVITPLLMAADFLVNDRDFAWETVSPVSGLVPPLAYLLFILTLGAFGFRWRWGGLEDGMTAPYSFLNYNSPAGWFGFRPETIDFSTIGIGVFYMILLMTLLVYLISRLVLRTVKAVRKTARCSHF